MFMMNFNIWFCFLLSTWIISGVFSDPVCYDELGCFETGHPWFTPLRPFPDPMDPEKINTTFYFVDRSDTEKTHVPTWPQIEIDSRFDNNKETVIITHGLHSSTDSKWMKNLTEAFLYRKDFNIFLVDWKGGSYKNYFQAASNTRIVAAEIIRFIHYLIEIYSAEPSTFYLMGHSLGAHVMSYVGKNISGIGRITALDPAKPGFQGKNASVRLDKSDAKFVDVIHTDGRNYFPFFGLGMSDSIGSVDFFINGGKIQPGCLFDGKKHKFSSIISTAKITMDVIHNFVTCSHSRAARYMAVAIKGECKMWGHRYNSTLAHHKYAKFISNEPCNEGNCNLMGLETPDYPARGSFIVQTTGTYPFCEKTTDEEKEKSTNEEKEKTINKEITTKTDDERKKTTDEEKKNPTGEEREKTSGQAIWNTILDKISGSSTSHFLKNIFKTKFLG